MSENNLKNLDNMLTKITKTLCSQGGGALNQGNRDITPKDVAKFVDIARNAKTNMLLIMVLNEFSEFLKFVNDNNVAITSNYATITNKLKDLNQVLGVLVKDKDVV